MNPTEGLYLNVAAGFVASDNSDPTKSASLAQAEREIKALSDENKELKKQITEIRSAYKQLVTECSHENFDERRVNFLKAQMIQLERQILVLNEALSSRSSVLLEVENSLTTIADLCRHYLSKDSKIGEVPVAKDDLHLLVKTAESARKRLYKNIENTNAENVERPVFMLDRFLKHRTHKPVTLLDICSGTLEHINLKHVAKLESKLSQLYRQLMLVNQTIHLIVKTGEPQFQQEKAMFVSANQDRVTKILSNEDTSRKVADLPKCLYARLGTQVTKACNMLKDTTIELLGLSILIPSAPWPLLKKPFLKEFTTDDVMSKIKGLSKSKHAAVSSVVDSLMKAMNYSCHMANVETRALKDEVSFHQKIYYLQTEYVDNLLKALRLSYEEFQSETDKLICQPMTEILGSYDILQKTASEEALKHFLKVFKGYHVQMTEAVKNLSLHLEEKQGAEAISVFGEQFFHSINKLRAEQQKKRDTNLDELDVARRQYDDYTEELLKMFPDTQLENTVRPEQETDLTARCSMQPIGGEEEEKSEQKEGTVETVDVSYCTSPADNDGKRRGNEYYCTVDGVRCSCGVESGETEVHRDKVDHVDREQTAMEATPADKKPVLSRRRPPRLMKGVPPSKLVLKPVNANKSPMSENCTVDQLDINEYRAGARSAQSLSDASQASGDGCCDNRQTIQTCSSSLSRSTQRMMKPSQLEPLISPLASLRVDYKATSPSKPWK